MHQHPCFDLWLHEDDELESVVESGIRERVTLHEWPLSCVQRLTTVDGRKLIYKAQFGPTVEAEFCANARSGLLPRTQTIYQRDGHYCTLSEYIDGPLLEDLGLSESEAVRVGREVLAQIAEIEGDLPTYLDVSDDLRWAAFVSALLCDLRTLIGQGAFRVTDEVALRTLEQCAFSEPVLSAICTTPGLIHGDFTGEHVFVLPDGYRVIDWQRPVLGPTGLDLAVLLSSLGYAPQPYVCAGAIQVWHILSIHWFTQCKLRWLPQGETYDQQVADLVGRLDGAGAGPG